MLLAALLAAAPAPLPAQPPAEPQSVIVVTGTSLDATRRALDECIARKCPAEEDIRATLAHAENLFVAGDYTQARSVLRKSIGRNSDEAKSLPVPVSNLYRANARVSAHLGEGEDYQRSAYRTWSILNEGAGVPDWRRLDARLEVAKMVTALQGKGAGIRAYRQLADEAERLGRHDVAGIARLKALWIDYIANPTNPIEKELRQIAADADPRSKTSRLGALFLLARIERNKGRAGTAADALVAELSRSEFARPTLLFEPPVDTVRGDTWGRKSALPAGMPSVTQDLPTDNFDGRWADVGFWVGPDGRVGDIEILRESGKTPWMKPILASIQGRIYSPAADGQGHYRVERYSYTSLWRSRIDTKLRVRSQDARIERLDLTRQPPAGS